MSSCLKQNPLAVLGVLRDLHKAAIPLRISWNVAAASDQQNTGNNPG